jgi:hypothetical protein
MLLYEGSDIFCAVNASLKWPAFVHYLFRFVLNVVINKFISAEVGGHYADLKLTKLHGLSPQANYTDRLSDRRLSAKLVPTLADRGCRVVSATIPPQSLISVF